MNLLPDLLKTGITAVKTVGKFFVWRKSEKISPHIELVQEVIVDSVKHKYEYLPDIKALRSLGKTFTEIARILPISASYACKLLKNKK